MSKNITLGAVAPDLHGIDLSSFEVAVPTTLYEEALGFAQRGKLEEATERLGMILILHPDDCQAILLLAKVLAARGHYREALSSLEATQANGGEVPDELRASIHQRLLDAINQMEDREAALVEVVDTDLEHAAMEAELNLLRHENRTLHSTVRKLTKANKLWSDMSELLRSSGSTLALAQQLNEEAGSITQAAHDATMGAPAPSKS